MPTARYASAAVDILGVGVLVVGGVGEPYGYLNRAELLEKSDAGIRSWKPLNPMIKARWWPSAVYFEGKVFVASQHEESIEMLSPPYNETSQWTIIFTHSSVGWGVQSMCLFNTQIVVAGELTELNRSA